MKTLLLSLSCAAGLTATTAHAQVFQPQAARDILIGGVAGAIIGDHNDHRALEGAAIGAAAGYVWSALTAPPAQPAYAPPVPAAPVTVVTAAPAVVYAEPVRCAPPVRTVVVTRPVAVVPCAPRVVYRYPRREVVYVPARPYLPARRVVVYEDPRDCRR